MKTEQKLSDEFKTQLESISSSNIMDPNYRKKKLTFWIIRNIISVILYLLLWKYHWVKWTLIATVPLSLANLFAIIASPYLLKKKIEKVTRKIKNLESIDENVEKTD